MLGLVVAEELDAEPVLLLAAVVVGAALGLEAGDEPEVEAAAELAEEAVDGLLLADEVEDSVPLVAAMKGPMIPPCW